MKKTIFTIGYAGFEFEDACRIMARHNATKIVDVRSSPFSKRFPQWNRSVMEDYAEYLWLGERLGAHQTDAFRDGMVSREAVWKTPEFQDCLAAVPDSAFLLCAEKDPATCHRALLLAEWLDMNELAQIIHISPLGEETHAQLCRRIRKKYGLFGPSLLHDEKEQHRLAMEKAWREIAFRDMPEDIPEMRR